MSPPRIDHPLQALRFDTGYKFLSISHVGRISIHNPIVSSRSVRALESPLMTEAALNWGFAPSAHRLADKIIGAPSEQRACRRQDTVSSAQRQLSSRAYSDSMLLIGRNPCESQTESRLVSPLLADWAAPGVPASAQYCGLC